MVDQASERSSGEAHPGSCSPAGRVHGCLHQRNIVRQMFSIWYIPGLDLFATHHNNKLAEFVSPVPDPQAIAVDALSIPWDGNWVYAYPPTALMQRVLHKLVRSSQCRMLLVAPLQHYHRCLPMLLRLVGDFPLEMPPLPRLLRQPQSEVFHSHPNLVHLFVLSLSSVACESDSFLKQLPTLSARQLEYLPPAPMTVSGEFMRVGVVQNRLVLSKPLFSN